VQLCNPACIARAGKRRKGGLVLGTLLQFSSLNIWKSGYENLTAVDMVLLSFYLKGNSMLKEVATFFKRFELSWEVSAHFLSTLAGTTLSRCLTFFASLKKRGQRLSLSFRSIPLRPKPYHRHHWDKTEIDCISHLNKVGRRYVADPSNTSNMAGVLGAVSDDINRFPSCVRRSFICQSSASQP